MEMLIHSQKLKGKLHTVQLSEPIIFADNEKNGRSGHLGHAMTEFAPGKIMAFSANTSAIRSCGHSAFGWMDYSISEDYGQTWSVPVKFPYSWEALLDGVNTISVEKVITCDNGDIVAFCLRNCQRSELSCEPWWYPRVVISKDQGKTWGAPVDFSEYKGRIYDALYYKGVAYVLQHCNDAAINFCSNKPEHVHRLFKSVDNCQTFEEVCVVPFDEKEGLGYGNLIITPEEKMIAYAYNVNDEQNMSYAISEDFGKTWIDTGKSFVKNRIRNPQVGLLDGQFILHGRAGRTEAMKGSFVIYTSKDGVEWDDGLVLAKDERPSCFYSENLTVVMPNGKQKMFVKYSETYHRNPTPEQRGQVNSMMMTIETVE